MKSIDPQAPGCFSCANFKLNGLVQIPSDDGFDCMLTRKRVVDLFRLRNTPVASALQTIYPPFGIPSFCPLPERNQRESLDEMECL